MEHGPRKWMDAFGNGKCMWRAKNANLDRSDLCTKPRPFIQPNSKQSRMSHSPGFEDDANPFQIDSFDHTPSMDSVDLPTGGSGAEPETPTSPVGFAAQQASVATVGQTNGRSGGLSPSYPTHAQGANKVDFCCGRDQYLHSGDDMEILVSDSIRPKIKT
jgi:hypothetical protein